MKKLEIYCRTVVQFKYELLGIVLYRPKHFTTFVIFNNLYDFDSGVYLNDDMSDRGRYRVKFPKGVSPIMMNLVVLFYWMSPDNKLIFFVPV
jgi:hypothetical protein